MHGLLSTRALCTAVAHAWTVEHTRALCTAVTHAWTVEHTRAAHDQRSQALKQRAHRRAGVPGRHQTSCSDHRPMRAHGHLAAQAFRDTRYLCRVDAARCACPAHDPQHLGHHFGLGACLRKRGTHAIGGKRALHSLVCNTDPRGQANQCVQRAAVHLG